jgi:hypothetical protein
VKKVTFIPNRGARLGHQFTEWLWGYVFCLDNGIEFYHSPFKENSPSGDGDKTLNLSYGEKLYKEYSGGKIKHKDISFGEYLKSDSTGLYVFDWNNFDHRNYVLGVTNKRLIQDDIRNVLRKKYYARNKPLTKSGNIAVHIRRDDITKKDYPDRYEPIGYYLKILRCLHKQYPDYTVRIFSSNVDARFNTLKEKSPFKKTIFCVDATLKLTLMWMINAEILITSASGLSFIAALISDNSNAKICRERFWHKWPEESLLI